MIKSRMFRWADSREDDDTQINSVAKCEEKRPFWEPWRILQDGIKMDLRKWNVFNWLRNEVHWWALAIPMLKHLAVP